jgi:hypothetical protein
MNIIIASTQEVVIRLFSNTIQLPYSEAMALLQKAYDEVTAPTGTSELENEE